MKQGSSVNVGPSVLGLLGVAFIVLKLVGVIAWSWWWVLAPFWAPTAALVLLFVLSLALAALKGARRD